MRSVETDFNTNLNYSVIRPRFFFSLVTAAGTSYWWSGRGDKSWDGHTWSGNGVFRGFDDLEETIDAEAESLPVYLTAESPTMVSLFLSQLRQGGAANLWFAIVTEGQLIVDDPHCFFSGELDTAELDDSSDQATITLTLTSKLIRLKNKKEWRYTDAHQNMLFPGDKGFEYVPQMREWVGYWGFPEDDGKTPPPPKIRGGI